jgi:hypothetical protein
LGVRGCVLNRTSILVGAPDHLHILSSPRCRASPSILAKQPVRQLRVSMPEVVYNLAQPHPHSGILPPAPPIRPLFPPFPQPPTGPRPYGSILFTTDLSAIFVSTNISVRKIGVPNKDSCTALCI